VLRRDVPFGADHRVVEVALIAEFGAYWLVQTVELWNTSPRDELVDAECRLRGEKLMQAL